MSIDHGKLLVACRRKLEAYCDAYGLEYVGGQELSSLLADIDRALAQPAEAVEGEVEQAELRRFQENNTAFVSALPRKIDKTDVAQGAVATVCLVGERYAHGHMVSVELQLASEDAPAPNIGDRYYTHPQATPAQGAVAIIERASDRYGGYLTHCDVTLRLYNGFVPEAGIQFYTCSAPVALRYFASGPEGSFFTDDLALARGLVNKYDPDGDWTITDLQNPTGDT